MQILLKNWLKGFIQKDFNKRLIFTTIIILILLILSVVSITQGTVGINFEKIVDIILYKFV